MRHLVTGGAGFIGSHLAQALLDRGDHVAVIDDLTGGWEDNIPPGVTPYLGDLCELDLDWVFDRFSPSHIWHTAAYAAEGLSHWVREHNVRNNYLASVRLINAALRAGVERFTYTSSMAVYGSQTPPFKETMTPRPEDPYGIAKHAVEQELEAAQNLFGLNYVIFRPHNVYGPGQNIGDPYRNVVGIFMRKASQGKPVGIYGDGQQTRAFSYITDIIDPMVRSLDFDLGGFTFNIGGEQPITITHLAEQVCQLFPGTQIVYLPERYEVKHAYSDHYLARQLLDFTPKVPLDLGLASMAAWVRANGIRWSQTPQLEHELNLPEYWNHARTRSGP